MNLTCHREQLPTTTPQTGSGADSARAAALTELNECRALLRTPGPLLASPRMRRRYQEALAWVALYENNTEENAA